MRVFCLNVTGHLARGIFFLALLLSGSAWAQDDEGFEDEFALLEEELKIDEIKSASKHRQSIFWSPSAISVFTREDIRSSGASTVSDFLRRVPGFDVYEMKPSFPVVGARALTDHSNNLVLVLVDGREAIIEISGFCIWAALTIDIEEIERIEVIRGPGSTLYGANAFAGVVSITTMAERPEAGGDVYIDGGEQGRRRLFGRVRNHWSLGDGTLSFSAGIGTLAQTSVADPHYTIVEALIRTHAYLRYRLGSSLDVSLHGGYLKGGGPLYMIIGDYNADDVINPYVMGQAQVGLTDSLKLRAQAYYIKFLGHFHFRSHFESYGTWLADVPDFFMDTNSADAQAQLEFEASENLHLIGGANIRYSFLESDKIVAQGLSELRGAGFFHAQWKPWDFLQLTGGMRYDVNSQTEGALSPRAVVVYRPVENHSLRAGYGLAFRKPSFIENQLHIQGETYNPAFPEILDKLLTSIGNEDLTNEKVHSVEAGWRGHFLDGRLKTSADLFFNIYQDRIIFKSEMALNQMGVPDIDGSTFQFVNEPLEVRAFGGEVELTWSSGPAWLFWGNLGLRWVSDENGTDIASEPRLRVNLGGRWSPGRGPLIDIAIHYVSTYQHSISLPEKPFDPLYQSELGNRLLAVGRFGYRLPDAGRVKMEAGLAIRAPLGPPFREYTGWPMRPGGKSFSSVDWAGEKLVRLASLYLRGSF
jgi:iron complex outermembrane receptor protein